MHDFVRCHHSKQTIQCAPRRALLLALTLLLAFAVAACGRDVSPTPEAATAAVSQSELSTSESVAIAAPETNAEASTPLPVQSAEGGTIPAPAATRGPLEETIERLFLDSLPLGLTSASAGLGINGIALLPAAVSGGTPATWLVHTVGTRDFNADQVHRVNIYQQAGEHVVAEVARLNLGDESFGSDTYAIPDFLAANAASQVAIEPSALWFALEGGVGAHAGVFNLLRFDPATRELSVALAASNPSPGVAHVQDVNGDGFGEIIVNASDPYVFCYACSVRLPQLLLYRWNGSEVAQVELREDAGNDSADVAATNTRLLTLARAGLWQELEAELSEAESIAEEGSNFAWNLALLRLNAEAKRAASEDVDAPFPLLAHLFYGDFEGAGALLRAYSAAELFATPSALISGTVASGWEETLANWIERSTAPALAFDPEIADGWLVRAFGAWLIGNISESSAWLEHAQAIQPGDPFLAAALDQVAAPGTEETPHLSALSPVEVRSGPGNSFPILLTLQPGEVVTVTGRFGVAPDLWWQIPARGTNSLGWVRADEARVSEFQTDHVPDVVAPAQVAPVAQQGRILYSAESPEGVASLYEIAVAPAATPLLLLEDARQPALRAQGDVIAFASNRADMLGIGGINLHTGERLRYTFNLEDALPRWNGAGDQILFSSTREGDRRPRIYRIFAQGAVNAQTLRLGNDADWNAQSGRIVFKGCDATGNRCGLWTMQSDGTGSLPLTDNPGDARPRWSPDSNRVLFMSDQRDSDWELYEVSLIDGAVTRLTTSPGEDGLPVYNAAGDAIAWMHHDESGWSLRTRQLTGGSESTVHSFGADFPNWLDHGLDWTE